MKQLRNSILALLLGTSFIHAAESTLLYEEDFSKTLFGHTPSGWEDLTRVRPARNWAVDGNGVLRQTIKNHTGLITYTGYTLQPKPAASLGDARIEAIFSKTEDSTVSFGIAGRVQDRNNYYLARFSGSGRLELMRMKDGVMTPLDAVPLPDLRERRETGVVTLQPYRSGQRWMLSLTLDQNRLTAVVRDAEGREQARLGATDDSFTKGAPGICCTRFASAASFRLEALKPVEITADAARLAKRNVVISEAEPDYPVVKAVEGVLSTPAAKLAPKYDIIIAGAGTGGWAAAVQAARLGSRVLLLEESDWIGGQMAAAGVTTMDEDSVWMKFPVRERGLYREFHESITLHYLSREKDPQVAYYGWPDQLEGGYEPKVARAVMQGFIHEVKNIDVSLRTRVSAVTKQGDTVTGATLSFADGSTREIVCAVLVDATEYGDVIPLTGARYRVGNQTSDKSDPAALVQDHTWTCIVREYPEGVPEHLIIKEPPPGYAKGSGKRYRSYTNEGVIVWGGAGKGYKGPRHWRTYFAWRGMADSDSPLIGESSHQRHTQCGFNGGNDYPVTAATIEDPAQRLLDEREGIYKTLGALYYFQHDLGLNWSLAEDEGYDTPANRAKMKALNLRPDLEALAVHLPQHPYVRECRRIIGVQTLTAHDLGRFENAKHVRTSVAMGDYFMDLDHGKTAHAIEPELDSGELPKGGGPFQVPFEVFIPGTIDGFLPAEKNISQSRIANGATRLQPITMLTGQAAGTIAALAVKQGVQPRALKPMQVQHALLESGCTLIQRWYADVPWGTELWRATQLLSLYQILDRPGDIDHDNTIPLGSKANWGVELEISAEEQATALQRMKALTGKQPTVSPETRHAGDFAMLLAKHLVSSTKP
jgi:hypothetical protein